MSAAGLVQVDKGRFRVEGDLDFAGVAGLLGASEQLFAQPGDLLVDLTDVAHANSAGLALLVEWLARARRERRQLQVVNLPESMRRLAKLSNLESLILSDGEGQA